MGEAARRKAQSFIAEIDEAELAVRLAEIGIGIRRPPGMPARQAITELEERARQSEDPYAIKVLDDFKRMAREAVRYFGECVAAGSSVS